jgi:hypothetical protein
VVPTGWSSVFLEHCEEIFLLTSFQEGGVFWRDAYAYDGDAPSNYKDPS